MTLNWQTIGKGIGLAAVLVLWWWASRLMSLEALLDSYERTLALVSARRGAALALYGLIYAITAAAGLPAATLLTVMGGAVFGWPTGGTATVFAATLGACGLFYAARSLASDFFRAWSGRWMNRVAAEFHAAAASYLLLARLMPVFPFAVVTLAAALLGARFSTFAWTTFFGIIPGTFAYALVGSGLNETLLNESRRLAACRAIGANCVTTFDQKAFVTRDIVIGLAVLAAVMLFSLVVKRLRVRKPRGADRVRD